MLRIALLAGAVIATPAFAAETYRLVHAIGNEERVIAKGMTKRGCEARKREHIAVAGALGAGGTTTCLPDSFFND